MNNDQLMFVGQKAFIEKEGETDLTEALKREVKEETGLEIEIDNPFTAWLVEFPPDHRNQGKVFLVGYKCKYISGEIKLSHEHTEYKWVNKDNFKGVLDGAGHSKALEKYFHQS